jgi:hypothetical protein
MTWSDIQEHVFMYTTCVDNWLQDTITIQSWDHFKVFSARIDLALIAQYNKIL